jgi:hypothetical protein
MINKTIKVMVNIFSGIPHTCYAYGREKVNYVINNVLKFAGYFDKGLFAIV